MAAGAAEAAAEAEATRKAEEAAARAKREAEPVVEVENPEWTITAENIEKYVGKPPFTSDRLYDIAPAGVVMGLAWTSMGGSALYIEVVSVHAKPATHNIKPKDGEVVVLPAKDGSESDKKEGGHPTGGSIKLTGKMGDVMQESAYISYTVARRFLRALPGQDKNDYLDTMALHMHVPEGATPKDGPSAGVTMTTALLSVALDK